MSGGTAVAWGMAAMAAASAASSVYSSNKQANAQKDAANKAQAQAEKDAKAQEEATNKADRNAPDTSAILSAAQQAGKGGVSSTMLTGSSGVDQSSLSLGKSTLLGG